MSSNSNPSRTLSRRCKYCIVVVVFLLHFSAAKAQTVDSSISEVSNVCLAQLEYSRGDFYLDGAELSADELCSLIGEDIYTQTYLSAIKQRRLGKSLLIAGIPVTVAGFTVFIASGLARSSMLYYGINSPENMQRTKLFVTLGFVAFLAGELMVNVSIPFLAIGSTRLNWIQDNYNQKSSYAAQFHIGATPNGFGLTFSF